MVIRKIFRLHSRAGRMVQAEPASPASVPGPEPFIGAEGSHRSNDQ